MIMMVFNKVKRFSKAGVSSQFKYLYKKKSKLGNLEFGIYPLTYSF